MDRTRTVELGDGRLLADLGFRDEEGLVASYFLPQPKGWSVIETGPTTCQGRLLEGLAQAGIDPKEVRRVFVTHIHLDHAGGLGALAASLPNAAFYAHREGIPHLVDPIRLVASARRAWGAASDGLWGPIVPVPTARISPLSGGEKFSLQHGELEVIATPGHARHHLAFLDTGTGALFTGDAAGVRLPGSWRPRPAVPPPDADLELLFESLERMASAGPRRVLYSHFGEGPDGPSELRVYRRAVEEWRDVALASARTDPSPQAIAHALRQFEERAAAEAGGAPPAPAEDLISGYDLAAQGLLRYFRVRGLLAG